MKRIMAMSALALLASRAPGQSMNIDFNNTAGNGAGVPAASFGGAAGQPGVWNNITSASATTSPLVALDGSATTATITRPLGTTFAGAADAGATGDNAKLLLDYDSLTTSGTLDYAITNLSSGWYAVYTYAVRPNANTTQARVEVLGSQSLDQDVGGDLANNDMLPNVTHGIHIYYVLPNWTMHVKVSETAFGTATCNGIQLRKITVDDRIRFYVKKNAVGPQDGTSWATAYRDLQPAMRMAANIHGVWAEIWVAQGFYYPTTGTDRSASFVLDPGLLLYGGFQGTETTLAQRTNPWLFITALSGSIGSSAANDNSYHVVRVNFGGPTVIDGFSIANGYANGAGDDAHGGGLKLANSSVRVQNCKFLSNTSASNGGAVYAHGAEPRFIDCLWYNNSATNGSGGGVYMYSSGKLWVQNGDFRKNYAAGPGGAISLSSVQSDLANCFFDANTASFGHGGAFYTAGDNEDDSTISNCTFSMNHSGMVGGGLYVNNASHVALNNSILWGNTDATGASVSAQQRGANGNTGASLSSFYTTVQGLNADPRFVDADGADNVAGNFDDDCRLQSISPCIDAASNVLLPVDTLDMDLDGDVAEKLPLDLDKNPRRLNSPSSADTGVGPGPIADRGCFEFQVCAADFDGDGFVTGLDFDLYVQAFEAGEEVADFDQDGFITGVDFDLYVQSFEAGC